jgi:nicotinamide-nucleotide amidase
MIPEGAVAIDPAGTAPGLVVPADGQVVVVLPGPPRELQEMWPRALAAAPAQEVLDRAEPYKTLSIPMFGIPESELAKALREIEDGGVALDQLEITTCLRGSGWSPTSATATARRTAEGLRAGLAERLGQFTTRRPASQSRSQSSGCSASAPSRWPKRRRRLLAARLTLRPGSSAWFAGGVVSYPTSPRRSCSGSIPS